MIFVALIRNKLSVQLNNFQVRLRTKYQDVTTKLNFVSCQFAFHYSFETLPQAECMIRNASEALEPGGYFIGTIPDAYDLVYSHLLNF